MAEALINMAEYKSFHYLMHDQPGPKSDPVFLQPTAPPTFDELYPAREPIEIHRGNKFYWRSGHRVDIVMTEHRACKCIVIRSTETSANQEWCPLVVDIEALYPIINPNKTGKTSSGLSDEDLGKAAADYLLARLKVSSEPVPVPAWTVHRFRQVQVTRLVVEKAFSDEWETLELGEVPDIDLSGTWEPDCDGPDALASAGKEASERADPGTEGDAHVGGSEQPASGATADKGKSAPQATHGECGTEGSKEGNKSPSEQPSMVGAGAATNELQETPCGSTEADASAPKKPQKQKQAAGQPEPEKKGRPKGGTKQKDATKTPKGQARGAIEKKGKPPSKAASNSKSPLAIKSSRSAKVAP